MRDIIVNKIIPFSTVDGIGNRCAIFVQGCNVNCIYCHNSETINLCNECRECIEVCDQNALTYLYNKIHYNEDKCTFCDNCINLSKYQSSPKTKKYTVEELFQVVKRYKPFIRGITISGGEPTLYKDFLLKLFKKVKELGITCYVDTNGFYNGENLIDLIKETDNFLFDIKSIHQTKSLCRTQLKGCLENLVHLLNLNKVEEVRTVIIGDYDDSKNTVITVAKTLKNYPDVTYKLIKVHTLGLKKRANEAN